MERRHPLSDDDIDHLANVIVAKQKTAFHIPEKAHYDSHQRLDKLLDAYDNATNLFTKTFFALVIVGAIILAGVTAVKGIK